MNIHLAQIPPEGLHLVGEDPIEILEFNEDETRFVAPISYDVTASLMGDALLVQGRLWTKATLRCGKCLQDFECDVRQESFLVHKPLEGGELVYLTSEVREDILLQLPAYPVCRAQCQGLCPVCGQDLNKKVCRCERAVENPACAALDEALRTSKHSKK